MGDCCSIHANNRPWDDKSLSVEHGKKMYSNHFAQLRNLENNSQLHRSATENIKIQIPTWNTNNQTNCEKVWNYWRKDSMKRIKSTNALHQMLISNHNLNQFINKHNGINTFTSNNTNNIQHMNNTNSGITDHENTTITNNISNNNFSNNNIKINDREINREDITKILNVFKNNFLFDDLPEEVFQLLLTQWIQIQIPDNKYIYESGFEGDFFYIIAKGSVNIISKTHKIVKTYNQWESFGQMSWFNRRGISRLENSAKCNGDVIVYVLNGDSFQDIQNTMMKFRLEQQYEFLNSISIFQNLDNIRKYNISEKIQILEYRKDEKIIRIDKQSSSSNSNNKEHNSNNKDTNNNNITPNNSYYERQRSNFSCFHNHSLSQNTNESFVFLIKVGWVEIKTMNENKENTKYLSKKEYFGVDSIFINDNIIDCVYRKITITSLERTVLYKLSEKDLKDALGDNYRSIILFSMFKKSFLNHEYFKNIFQEKYLMNLFKVFQTKKYANGNEVPNKQIMLIIEGTISNANHEEIALRGDILGDEILKQGAKIAPVSYFVSSDYWITLEGLENDIISIWNTYKTNALSTDPTQLSDIKTSQDSTVKENSLSPKSLKRKKKKEKLLKNLKRINKLKQIPLFKYLSEAIWSKLLTTMVKQKYKNNDVIIKENTEGDKLYIIDKGRVKITKGDYFIREIEKGSCFGERTLLSNTAKILRTVSVIAIDDVLCYVLSKEDFDLLLGNKRVKRYLKNKVAIQNLQIEWKDWYFIKKLGKGKFGNVLLVHDDTNFYAIKEVSISYSRLNNTPKYLISERNIMLWLDHPFIVKLVKTLKSEKSVFFLWEYVDGQTWDDYLIKRCMYKQVNDTKFYISSLLIIIDYLHSKFVVHRDIKPSNVMIDSNGYIKLIDFGTSKIVKDYTNTVIGTPTFLAPEILKGKGYSMSCDYWSIGICAYWIYYGKTPFNSDKWNDVYEIYQNILEMELDFGKINENVLEWISGLLEKKVNKRWCGLNTIKQLRIFMDDVGSSPKPKKGVLLNSPKNYFDKILNYDIEPPHVPALIKEDIIDTNNHEKLEDYLKKNEVYGSNEDTKIRSKEDEWNENVNWAEEFMQIKLEDK